MAKKKRKFKINEDTMTTIVVSSLLFCTVITIVGITLAVFQVDVSAIVTSTHDVFGRELGLCCLIKLLDIYLEKKRQKKQKEDVIDG